MVEVNGKPILYSPLGKIGRLNTGGSYIYAAIPTAAGRLDYITTSTYARVEHPDWLGSSRFMSNPHLNTAIGAVAYAPFGESYNKSSAMRLNFTDQFQDSQIPDTYDFEARKLSDIQGRWLSPDPAGLAAVDLTNPQTWNRYAYVGNMPMSTTDPLGLYIMDCAWSDCGPGGPAAPPGFPIRGGGYDGQGPPSDTVPPMSSWQFCQMYDCSGGRGSFSVSGGGLPGVGGFLPGENSINFPVPNIAQPIIDVLSGGIPDFSPWGMPGIPGYNEAPIFDADPANKNADVPIYGLGGQGAAILAAAGKATQYGLGCVGIGGAIASGSAAASAPIISKPFSAGGTSGTSVASTVAGSVNLGTSVPTPVGMPGTSSFAWRASANLGRIIGRWLPWLGLGYGAYKVNQCLGG